MKKSGSNNGIEGIIGIVTLVVVLGLMVGTHIYNKEMDQNYAIKTLSELRGRVNEISYIDISLYAQTEEMQELLMNHLERISIYSGDMTNPYLRGFEITVTTSSVQNICDEIISQIDNQIYKIRFD